MHSTGFIALTLATVVVSTSGPFRRDAATLTSTMLAHGGRPDSLIVVPRLSNVKWAGAGLGGAARIAGTARFTSGTIVFRHQQLEGGEFTVDMRSLQLEGRGKGALRSRLIGPQLFDVARYPTARFVPRRAELVRDATYRVEGDLTMLGLTRPVSFTADVSWPQTGHAVVAASLTVNRADFDVGPAAGSAALDGAITIAIRLEAERRVPTVSAR